MKVAITGANGEIGRLLVPRLASEHELRLGIGPPPPGRDEEPFDRTGHDVRELEITDRDSVSSFLADMDAVVHLAGDRRVSASWDDVAERNISGTFQVFDGARRAGLSKVVFASSNHVVGGYGVEEQSGFDGSEPIRPDSLYGVSKAFGEALGRHLADGGGLAVICLRIGWVLAAPHNEQAMWMWLSPDDLGALVAGALRAEVNFGIYYGSSGNTRCPWDLSPARRDLGYVPREDAERFATSLGLDPVDWPPSNRRAPG
jgi:nucleoside-diphosphate-sugar epimerase